MFKKWWLYIQSWFKSTSDDMMDPEIEIQVAIDQAKKKNQDLRNQAANIVAHRTQLETKIEKAADEVGETREMAKQAILKAEEAKAAGDAEFAKQCAQWIEFDAKPLPGQQPSWPAPVNLTEKPE